MSALSYKVLFVSDIHMSNKLPQAQLVSNGQTDRLNDQIALWARIRAVARDRKVDSIFVLGDLFDKSLVDPVTLTATVENIVLCPAPVWVLPGNHDAVSTSGGRFVVEAFGKMGRKAVKYIGSNPHSVPLEMTDWLRFHPLEYCSADVAMEEIRAIRAGICDEPPNGRQEVLLMHHSILGCKHLGWTCDDGLDANDVVSGFDAVYSGHFHDTQKFGDNDVGLYLGAPMHHRMDDEGRPAGFWVVEFREDGPREHEFIPGGAPTFHTVKWKGSAEETDKANKAMAGDYLRVVVESTFAELTMAKPAVAAYVDALKDQSVRASWKHRPVYHHEVRLDKASDLGKGLSAADMIRAYVDAASVDKSGMDPNRLKIIGHEAFIGASKRDE